MEDGMNLAASSIAEIVSTLGSRYRTYRISCRLTQKEVAGKSGVSLLTIRRFETGKIYNITLSNLIALLKALDLADGLNELLPPMPPSPYAMARLQQRQPKRVRHGK